MAYSAPKGKPAPKAATNTGSFQLIMTTTSISIQGYSNVSRTMSASYTSPKKAPAGATASLAVPAGLGMVSPIPYTIKNHEAGATGAAQVEMIHYWNSAPTIPKGQPEVINTKTEAQKAGSWANGSSGFPDPMQTKYTKPNQFQLDETAKVAGAYDLKISYEGAIHVDMTDKQQFLGALTVGTPANPAEVDTAKAIDIRWTHVPNVVGYTVHATGKNAAGKTVYWENAYQASSTVYTGGAAAALKAGKLVAPDKSAVQIPAGIFSGQVSVAITGYSTEVKGTGPLNPWGWAQTMSSLQLGK